MKKFIIFLIPCLNIMMSFSIIAMGGSMQDDVWRIAHSTPAHEDSDPDAMNSESLDESLTAQDIVEDEEMGSE